MDKLIEFCCKKHLSVTLVASLHSESNPMVVAIDPCPECITDFDKDLRKDIFLEMMKETLEVSE